MQVHREQYRPKRTDDFLEYTLNLSPSALGFFISKEHGCCYFSKDQPGLKGETTTENIKLMWESLEIPQPTKFTSIALRCANAPGRELSCFGDVVLVINPKKIAKDTILVNGDFKNIGDKIKMTNTTAHLRAFKDILDVSADDLETLITASRAGTVPRLIGQYFEARVCRPLTTADIQAIYTGTVSHPQIDEFLKHTSLPVV